MKKVFPLLMMAAMTVAGHYYLTHLSYSNPCDEPISFRIGDVDPRFGITKEELASVLSRVVEVWNQAHPRELIRSDQEGGLPVNLIFDERQLAGIQQEEMLRALNEDEQTYQRLLDQHRMLSDRYESDRAAYRAAIEAYNNRVDRLNTMIAEQNAAGVIPKEAQARFEAERESIEQFSAEIKRKEGDLEWLSHQVNDAADRLSRAVDESNRRITTYNRRFARERTFSQAEFVKLGDNRTINVYQFDDHDQLALVLAHEFGHALGLDHVSDPHSVLYHLMDQQDPKNLRLSSEDIAALRSHCGAN